MFLAIGMYPCGTYIADTALFVYLEQEYIQADSGHRRTKGQQLNWLETAVQGRSMRRLEGVLGKKPGVAETQLANPPKFGKKEGLK